MELAADARDAMGAADTADLAALARIAHGTDHLNEVAAEVGNQTHNSTSGNAPAVQRVFGDEVALADGLSDGSSSHQLQ